MKTFLHVGCGGKRKVGPISPIDILWGHRASLERGNLYMAHKVGFTSNFLKQLLIDAGFSIVATMRRGSPFLSFGLWPVRVSGKRK